MVKTRENNIHIFEPPCNVLFIIWTKMKRNSARTDFIWQSHETCRPIITELKTQNRVFSFLFSSQNRIKSSSEVQRELGLPLLIKTKQSGKIRDGRARKHTRYITRTLFFIYINDLPAGCLSESIPIGPMELRYQFTVTRPRVLLAAA